jgi:hypothetical protein
MPNPARYARAVVGGHLNSPTVCESSFIIAAWHITSVQLQATPDYDGHAKREHYLRRISHWTLRTNKVRCAISCSNGGPYVPCTRKMGGLRPLPTYTWAVGSSNATNASTHHERTWIDHAAQEIHALKIEHLSNRVWAY